MSVLVLVYRHALALDDLHETCEPYQCLILQQSASPAQTWLCDDVPLDGYYVAV